MCIKGNGSCWHCADACLTGYMQEICPRLLAGVSCRANLKIVVSKSSQTCSLATLVLEGLKGSLNSHRLQS